MTTFLKHTVSSDHDHGTAARTRKKISKSKKKFMICKDQRRCQIVSHKLNQSCPTIETRTNNLPVRWVHLCIWSFQEKKDGEAHGLSHSDNAHWPAGIFGVLCRKNYIFLFLFFCAYNVIITTSRRTIFDAASAVNFALIRPHGSYFCITSNIPVAAQQMGGLPVLSRKIPIFPPHSGTPHSRFAIDRKLEYQPAY